MQRANLCTPSEKLRYFDPTFYISQELAPITEFGPFHPSLTGRLGRPPKNYVVSMSPKSTPTSSDGISYSCLYT